MAVLSSQEHRVSYTEQRNSSVVIPCFSCIRSTVNWFGLIYVHIHYSWLYYVPSTPSQHKKHSTELAAGGHSSVLLTTGCIKGYGLLGTLQNLATWKYTVCSTLETWPQRLRFWRAAEVPSHLFCLHSSHYSAMEVHSNRVPGVVGVFSSTICPMATSTPGFFYLLFCIFFSTRFCSVNVHPLDLMPMGSLDND